MICFIKTRMFLKISYKLSRSFARSRSISSSTYTLKQENIFIKMLLRWIYHWGNTLIKKTNKFFLAEEEIFIFKSNFQHSVSFQHARATIRKKNVSESRILGFLFVLVKTWVSFLNILPFQKSLVIFLLCLFIYGGLLACYVFFQQFVTVVTLCVFVPVYHKHGSSCIKKWSL